ncbi:MAG: MBL fold metallo-hydrolase [Deltaproteobacteria bacterium]|nr:MBL fold metallo-hydrolase [Deltaproteobacteria bacterium]
MNLRRLAAAVLATLLFVGALDAAAGELQLRFLDVGQGDAILITNDDKAVLVDTGPTDAVATLLEALNVTALDLLLISHNHMDHFGGADVLLATLPVRNFLDNGFPAKTKMQETVLKLVDAKKIPYLEAKARDISLGDVVLHILPPLANAVKDDQNDRSLGVVVERGSFKAFLPGDAEVAALGAWLQAGLIPPVTVLKAAHHGSRNGVTPQLISRANPEVVVISCAAGNDYGHPHEAAMRYYRSGKRRIMRTDEMGHVLVRVQPDGRYEVSSSKTLVPIAASAAEVAPGVASPATAPASESAAPAPKAVGAPAGAKGGCCRVCTRGAACGDNCIPRGFSCNKPKGCACDG